MDGYDFTVPVRRSLARAREEAVRLRHEYVGTEHILLGLISLPRTSDLGAAAVFESFGVSLDDLARRINQAVKPGPEAADHPIRSLRDVARRAARVLRQGAGPSLLPYTSRAKKSLELAMWAARKMNHGYVGTEHLLIGLLAEERGLAAQALSASGLTAELVQARVMKLAGEQ